MKKGEEARLVVKPDCECGAGCWLPPRALLCCGEPLQVPPLLPLSARAAHRILRRRAVVACPAFTLSCTHAPTLIVRNDCPPCADGFGEEGRGAEVPPGATLEIDLTLLGWHKVENVTGERRPAHLALRVGC